MSAQCRCMRCNPYRAPELCDRRDCMEDPIKRSDRKPYATVSDGVAHAVELLDSTLGDDIFDAPIAREALSEVRERLLKTQELIGAINKRAHGVTPSWNGIHLGRFDTEDEAHACLNNILVMQGHAPIDWNDKGKVVRISISEMDPDRTACDDECRDGACEREHATTEHHAKDGGNG